MGPVDGLTSMFFDVVIHVVDMLNMIYVGPIPVFQWLIGLYALSIIMVMLFRADVGKKSLDDQIRDIVREDRGDV